MFLKIFPATRIKLVLGWLFKTGKVETDLSFIACCMCGTRPAPLFQDLGRALPRSSVFVFGFGKPACERLSLGRCSSFGR